MVKQRLDQEMVSRGLVPTRSQAESYIKLGDVSVDGAIATKPGHFVSDTTKIKLTATEQYVSRAALKLASVAESLKIKFANKTVLDVGSSTGGFTDFALKHGADKVIAVEVGKNQLHPTLHDNPKIELHEQTDIRDVVVTSHGNPQVVIRIPDIVVIDVSFISLRDILPHVFTLCDLKTVVVAMVKPQFEAVESNFKHKGVIKNDRMRREILKDFENWVTSYGVIIDKADSSVSGAKGNQERFYKLKKI